MQSPIYYTLTIYNHSYVTHLLYTVTHILYTYHIQSFMSHTYCIQLPIYYTLTIYNHSYVTHLLYAVTHTLDTYCIKLSMHYTLQNHPYITHLLYTITHTLHTYHIQSSIRHTLTVCSHPYTGHLLYKIIHALHTTKSSIYYTLTIYNYPYITHCTVTPYITQLKGKGFPLQAWNGSCYPRRLRLLDLLDFRHYKDGKVVTLTHRPPSPPGISWYSFLEAESTPGHTVPSVAAEKIPSETIGDRSRDLPTSSAVH
jgi:hypothetical protein